MPMFCKFQSVVKVTVKLRIIIEREIERFIRNQEREIYGFLSTIPMKLLIIEVVQYTKSKSGRHDERES